MKQFVCFFFFTCVLCGCGGNIRPETRTLAREISDSTQAIMRITDDSEFFRRYIAFNVRFTLRHQILLNDTVIRKELQQEIHQTALVQEAQKRVNAIQNSLR
jgi:predicted membrane chloride channel (bestrophin family)